VEPRAHLASLVATMRGHGAQRAVVAHRGVRSHASSYAELAALAGRFAAELGRRGVAPGERVVLWGANSAEWIAAFFGCVLRGAIAVPLDAAGTAEFARRVVADVRPRLVVVDAGLLAALARGLDADVPTLLFPELASALPEEPDYRVSEAVGESTPLQIVFTSGTTSEPKGIVHTHGNVLASLRPIEQEMQKYLRYERWFHPLRFLHSLPLSHVFGQFMGMWTPVLLAAEVHVSDDPTPARTVELLRRERISVLVAVPRVLDLLRGHLLGRFAGLAMELEQAQGSSAWARWWRFRRVHNALGWKFWAAISGGAAVGADLEGFWRGLGLVLIQGYGMTETAALVTLNHPFKVGRGTLGKPLPGREVQLSEEGEVLVRGAMLAEQVWRDGRMQPRAGEWLATGDLAERTAAGELRFLGRKGEAIVTAAGMNVHPADVEAALLAQPGMRACAVVGCATARGMEPVAVVVFAGEAAGLQAAVVAANRGLAAYQQVRRVLRWPGMALPYTSSGKLLRRQVQAWACARLAEETPGSSAAEDDALLGWIAEVTGERRTATRQAQGNDKARDALRLSEDLRLDSLGRVQLQSLLEQRLGVELDEDAMARAETVGELRALVGLGGQDSAFSFQLPASSLPVSQSASVPVPLEDVYPRWVWSWPVRWLRVAFVEAVLRPLVALLAAPRVVWASGVAEAQGPLLVIANHGTAFDGALVLYALPGALRRRLAIAMAGEMLRAFRGGDGREIGLEGVAGRLLAPPVYGLLTALFHVFPLPRMRGFRRSFGYAGEAMDRGESVLVFPEGRRSAEGAPLAFRPGIGLLAEETRAAVLPVALVGLGALKAAQRGWFRSGRLEVRVGAPLAFREGMDAQQRTAELQQRLRAMLE